MLYTKCILSTFQYRYRRFLITYNTLQMVCNVTKYRIKAQLIVESGRSKRSKQTCSDYVHEAARVKHMDARSVSGTESEK